MKILISELIISYFVMKRVTWPIILLSLVRGELINVIMSKKNL